MSKTVENIRKLAELACGTPQDSPEYRRFIASMNPTLLLDLTAAPAVERQEPVAWLVQWNSIIPGVRGHREVLIAPPELLSNSATVIPLYTSPAAPVEVVLNDPIPITDGTARLMEAYRLGEFSLEGGSPTVEAMSCASYDNHSEAIHDNDFDSYTAGYQAAMYEEGKSLLGLIARLDKVKEMNQ